MKVVPVLIGESLYGDFQEQRLADPGALGSQVGMGTELRVVLRFEIRDF